MPVQASRKIAVAVTGPCGSLGRKVLSRLLADPRVSRVVAFDLSEPAEASSRLEFERLDLTRPSAAGQMARTMRSTHCTALVHLAFFSSRVLDRSYAHEVESFGTTNALAACHDTGIETLLLGSSTAVYGASAGNPNLLTEKHPLAAQPASRFVADRIEAERQVYRFAEGNPGARAAVLRFAPVVGPSVDTPFTRFLGSRLVPAVLGHDPLVQCVHEDDVGEAAQHALFGAGRGAFNIVGRGVLPLSVAARLTGTLQVPLPEPLAGVTLEALEALGLSAMPAGLLAYLRHLWVADGARAERELGFKPRFSTREAIVSFAQSRRQQSV